MLARDAVRLAGKTGSDAVYASSKLSEWEGCQIAAEDRRRIQAFAFHERKKLDGCSGFPFAKGNCPALNSKVSKSGMDSFVQHADSGAERDNVLGISHTIPPFS